MKKLICLALSLLLILPAAAVTGAEPAVKNLLNEQFSYADGSESFGGWEITKPDVTDFLVNSAKVQNGMFQAQMKKNLGSRLQHKITAGKDLAGPASGEVTVNAGIGIDEPGLEGTSGTLYSNTKAKVNLLDADGNLVISAMYWSNPNLSDTSSAIWSLTNLNATPNDDAALGKIPYSDYGSEPLYDGTIHNIRLHIDPEGGKAELYINDMTAPKLSVPFTTSQAITRVELEQFQYCYKNPRVMNSVALFDYITVDMEDTQQPPVVDPDDNPPADEDEGLENQTSILYDSFSYEDGAEAFGNWNINLPSDDRLLENYVRIDGGKMKSKMKKSIGDASRAEHTISVSQDLSRSLSSETVVRAGLGLDETGSTYTNSQTRLILLDQSGAEVISVNEHSNYGAIDSSMVWSVKTAKTTAVLTFKDYAPKYDGTVYEVKLHLYPEKGTADFYLEDMEEPVLRDIAYNAQNTLLTKVELQHFQKSYNRANTTNSAAFFDYVKVDASVYVDPADQSAVEAAYNALEFSDISSEPADSVTKKLNLIGATSNGCVVVWESSDPSVISLDGIVTRDTELDKEVDLTAVIVKGYAQKTKSFHVTVPAMGKIQMFKFYKEDFTGKPVGSPVTDWIMTYPSPKSDKTDVFWDNDPVDAGNTVVRHSNDLNAPQSYFGFTAIRDMGTAFVGTGTIQFRIYLPQNNTASSIYFYNTNGDALIQLQANSSQWILNASGDNVTGPSVATNKWITIRMDVNTDEGYFQIYFDGVSCGTLNFMPNYGDKFEIARYGLYSWNKSSGLDSKIYFDDLLILENLNIRAEKIKNELNPPELTDTFEGGLENAVAANFSLPMEQDGAEISWSSSDSSAIAFDADGNAAVTRGLEDKAVTVTAHVNYKGYILTKEFPVVVVRQLTDGENVQFDKKNLTFESLSGELPDRLTKEFALPSKGSYGSTISWKADNDALTVSNGKAVLNRSSADRAVKLTAEIACGNAKETAEFELVVLKAYPNNLVEGGRVLKTSSELKSSPASNLIDDNFSTSYKTSVSDTKRETVIDMGAKKKVGAFLVWAEQNTAQIEIAVSKDNDFWETKYTAASVNGAPQPFAIVPSEARYVKLTLTPADSGAPVEINEIMAFESLLNDEEAIQADMEGVQLPSYTTKDIKLPAAGDNGSVITWSSNNPSVLTDEGKVYRQSQDVTVTLTATFAKNAALPQRKSYDVTVGKTASGSGGGGGGGAQVIGRPNDSANAVIPDYSTPDKEMPQPFSDVNQDMWSYKYIEALFEKGIVSGDGGKFYPKNAIKREEFSKMLMLSAALDVDATELPFTDVPAGSWYYDCVAKLYASGIVKGQNESVFGAGTNISRQDAAVMVWRTLELLGFQPESEALEFDDAGQIADYAKSAVGNLCALGILSGGDDNRFRPQDQITKEETAKIMSNLLAKRG